MRYFFALISAVFAIGMLCAEETIAQPAAVQNQGGEAIMKKKVLVVYYSRSGNTAKVAEAVAKKLDADIEVLKEKDMDRSGVWGYIKAGYHASTKKMFPLEPLIKNPADYELVVIGNPIWAWKLTPAVRMYLHEVKASLKKVAFFTTAGGSPNEKVVADFEETSGLKAAATLGLLEKELKDEAVFNKKIDEFCVTLQK